MKTNAGIVASDATPSASARPVTGEGAPAEPSLLALVAIFWGAIAFAVAATAVLHPDRFVKPDPDNLMRLVEVRDLLGGQGWFDLMQYRIDPPAGVLMHWSRVVDAPLAGLVLIGNLFGAGERFALIAWPLILLFGLMAGMMLSATALAGRRAALAGLILAIASLEPFLVYLPGNIDHHNAQLALLALMLAAALRLDAQPRLGAVLGATLGGGLALMLAIGLEMLPAVAVIGAYVAVSWALGRASDRAAALFGGVFAVAPAALYLLTGSPEAPLACDALSWAWASPAAVAGLGLTALVMIGRGAGVRLRLAGLAVLGGVTLALLLSLAPECLGGPYEMLSPELKRVWLDNIIEALPVWRYAAERPADTIASFGPPLAALCVVLVRMFRRPALWALPLALLVVTLAVGIYQVRATPSANVVALAVLAAWLGELAERRGVTSLRPFKAALPVLAAFLIACPYTYLVAGSAAVGALSRISGGTIAQPEDTPTLPGAPAGLSNAERECLDPASADLLAQVPRGDVLAPVFYASAVLMLSPHSVVAAPYHRAGDAILDAVYGMRQPPDQARAIVDARHVDYVAFCATSREALVTAKQSPDGLLAVLLAGDAPAWLEPVKPGETTMLRLWRVKRAGDG